MRLEPIEKSGATRAPTQGASEVVAQIIEATLSLYGRRGYEVPWTGYLAVEGNHIVGSCGFAGPPSAGEVEIAYFTFPGHEHQGVATRMARALLTLCGPAASSSGVRFIAHTLPEEGPSASVLRKLGFRNCGEIQHPEDGRVWKWSQHGPSEA